MLIGIVGLNGSGKDTVAHYLAEHYNLEHRALGQEIRDELKKRGKNFLNRTEMVALGNEMRQQLGFDYWCKRVIESSGSDNLVITSLRNPAEVEFIKSRGGVIIEVYAEQHVRFERIMNRVKMESGSHGHVESFEEFKAEEERELRSPDPGKQQLLRCISMAGYRLDNSGTEEQLHEEIDKLLLSIAVQ